MRRKILIYLGDGVAARSTAETARMLGTLVDLEKFAIESTDSATITSPSGLTNSALLVMPGGSDVVFMKSLRGNGNDRLREYVNEGGAYLGFCAGAYYGADRVEFDLGQPLEVYGARELKFFGGTAIGPAFGPNTFRYASEAGARAATLRWTQEDTAPPLKIYYNGGCYFEDLSRAPNSTVLAHYAELPGEPAAIVECLVGDGRAILCGVHPEYPPESLPQDTPEAKALYEDLKAGDAGRIWLLKALLRRLGIV